MPTDFDCAGRRRALQMRRQLFASVVDALACDKAQKGAGSRLVQYLEQQPKSNLQALAKEMKLRLKSFNGRVLDLFGKDLEDLKLPRTFFFCLFLTCLSLLAIPASPPAHPPTTTPTFSAASLPVSSFR